MENVNKVWIYTNASKSMNHFPDCYKCNKKNRKGCTQRRIYEFFETLYNMTENIKGVLSDKVKDGEISHKDYLTCFIYISSFLLYSVFVNATEYVDFNKSICFSDKRPSSFSICRLIDKTTADAISASLSLKYSIE